MSRPDEWADYLDPAEPSTPGLSPDHVEALDRFAAVLADESVWSDPPPSLRGSLLDRAMQEGVGGQGSREPAPRFVEGRRRTWRRRGGRPGSGPAPRTWWLAVAGAAAAVTLVVALAWPRPESTTFAMTGTARAAGATATARLEPRSAGLAITLEIKGLAAAPEGTYYAAWLRGPDGVVPVGTFHWRKGGIPIELWSGVLTDRYRELFVTVQREGLPPTPSADVVLTGTAPAS